MKYWKRVLFFSVILVLLLAGSAYADPAVTDGVRIFDMADLLEDGEEELLMDHLMDLESEMDVELVIVTTEDNPDSAMEFADNFYIENEFGVGKEYDGALFLIDMENGELWISTSGKMLRYLTDDRIDRILDDCVEYAYESEFYESADAFLTGVGEYYAKGIPTDQYNYDTETGKTDRYKSIRWYEFLIALGVASAVAGGAVLMVLRNYGMNQEGKRMSANFNLSYRKDSAFTMGSILADVLFNTYVTRSIIQSQKRSSGGGRSSSGRSSTHRSSGGRKMGGGGRKFR